MPLLVVERTYFTLLDTVEKNRKGKVILLQFIPKPHLRSAGLYCCYRPITLLIESMINWIFVHDYRHTLELLISFAKSFPGYFVPIKSKENDDKENKDSINVGKEEITGKGSDSGTKGKTFPKSNKSPDLPDFWDMLLKLDSFASKKGKSVARTHSNLSLGNELENTGSTFESSAFGQLISMLNWSVIKRSSQLTDKLLRLLSLISIGLTEIHPYRRQDNTKNKKTEINKEQSVPAPEGHLRLAVQVLTSKSCSEEGLEDATALLLNLSYCPDPTRQLVMMIFHLFYLIKILD